MNKEEYLAIIEELYTEDSVKRRVQLRQTLYSRLKPILEYTMSQKYCSQSANWTIDEGPNYYDSGVYVGIEYHIPRLSREDMGVSISLDDFLDDTYVDKLKEEDSLKAMKNFDPQI